MAEVRLFPIILFGSANSNPGFLGYGFLWRPGGTKKRKGAFYGEIQLQP